MCIEIEISQTGALALDAPQQEWVGEGKGETQYARFAGQEMVATRQVDETTDTYQLHFLGLVASGFASMEEAKASAASFAKEVFVYLGQMVSE